jgi:hypothetical protein
MVVFTVDLSGRVFVVSGDKLVNAIIPGGELVFGGSPGEPRHLCRRASPQNRYREEISSGADDFEKGLFGS